MRKASEAPDDVGVNLGISVGLAVAGAARQGKRPFLVDEILGMLEGQVEEHAFGARGAGVETMRDGTVRNRARERIGRECARAAAKHVARKLIDQDEKREPTI